MRSYIFTGFRHPSAAELDLFARAGISGVIVGLNNEDDPPPGGREGRPNRPDPSDLQDEFVFRHGAERGPGLLAATLDACAARRLECWPMLWLRLTRRYLDTSREAMEQFLGHPALTRILWDGERFLHQIREPGFSPAQAVESLFRPAWERDHVRHGLTDYAMLPAAAAPLLALECFDVALPQAYSIASWPDPIYRPGRTQTAAAGAWRPFLGRGCELVMGLAAYDQGSAPLASMLAQEQAAKLAGAGAVAWWSWPSASRATKNFILDHQARA